MELIKQLDENAKTQMDKATFDRLVGFAREEILKLDGPSDIRTSVTVCISDPEKMMSEIKNSKYPILKIKMGFENDEVLVEMLRNYSGKTLRVDANGGWSREHKFPVGR